MVGMALCYATTANIARLMAEHLNAPMIALLRNGFGVIPLLPLLLRGGLATMRTTRPGLHVVVTGRNARPALIEAADLVTEMGAVKHHFAAGVKAQQGIEF